MSSYKRRMAESARQAVSATAAFVGQVDDSLPAQIAEIERLLAYHKQFSPWLVTNTNRTGAEAIRKMVVLQAALRSLRQLSDIERLGLPDCQCQTSLTCTRNSRE